MGQVCSFCNPDGPGEPVKKGALDVAADPSVSTAANDGDWSRENEHGGVSGTGAPPPPRFPPGGDAGGHHQQPHPHGGADDPTSMDPESRKRLEEEAERARAADAERRRAEAEAAEAERARLDGIVSSAMRDMVSTVPRHQHHPSYGYGGNDYPGASARGLGRDGALASIAVGRTSTSFRGEIPPASSSPSDVVDVLSPGLWENVAALGTGRDGGGGGGWGGLAGLGGGEDPNIYLDDCAEGFLAGALPARQGEKRFRGVAPIVENLP